MTDVMYCNMAKLITLISFKIIVASHKLNTIRIIGIIIKRHAFFNMSNRIVCIDKISELNITQTEIFSCKLSDNKIFLTEHNSRVFELISNKPKLLQTRITGLPAEIVEIVFDKLNLRSQINFRLTCVCYSQYHLTNFWNTCGVIQPNKITNEILLDNIYIKKLNLKNNVIVTDISFLTGLKKVNIVGSNIS
jgi:hypothetical protein